MTANFGSGGGTGILQGFGGIGAGDDSSGGTTISGGSNTFNSGGGGVAATSNGGAGGPGVQRLGAGGGAGGSSNHPGGDGGGKNGNSTHGTGVTNAGGGGGGGNGGAATNGASTTGGNGGASPANSGGGGGGGGAGSVTGGDVRRRRIPEPSSSSRSHNGRPYALHPSGSVGTGELLPPNIAASSVTTLQRNRWIAKACAFASYCHGLGFGPVSPPIGLGDALSVSIPALNDYFATLATILAADGWQVIYPIQNQDVAFNGELAIQNDFSNDAGLGSRFLTNTVQHWWDHILLYIHKTYGNWPVTVAGFSGGGWMAYQLAALEQSSLTAFCAAHGATLFSNISPSVRPRIRCVPNERTRPQRHGR